MIQKNLLDTIHQRTSTRSFTTEQIADDILLKIAEAGRASPTANNKQQRVFTIVKNKEKIKCLAQAIEKETERKDYDFFSPAALLLVSVPDETLYSILEVGAATQNILLVATALGIGSVWTSQINEISRKPAVRKVLDQFNIPKDHLCFNVIALGYPNEAPEIKKRTEKIQLIS